MFWTGTNHLGTRKRTRHYCHKKEKCLIYLREAFYFQYRKKIDPAREKIGSNQMMRG